MERDLVPKILRWVLDVFKKNRRNLVASIFVVKNSNSSVVL
jgi:hypothetical protein